MKARTTVGGGRLLCDPGSEVRLLRGGIVNRTYGTDKNLYVYLFLQTIFGPIYYAPRNRKEREKKGDESN